MQDIGCIVELSLPGLSLTLITVGLHSVKHQILIDLNPGAYLRGSLHQALMQETGITPSDERLPLRMPFPPITEIVYERCSEAIGNASSVRTLCI